MGFLYILGPTIIMLALIGACGGIVWMQIRLSSRPSPVPALIPIVTICIVSVSMTVWAYSASETIEKQLQCDLPQGRTAEALIEVDENGEVMATTHITIKDKNGVKIDEIGWDDERLKDVQTKLKEDYNISGRTYTIREDGIKHGVKFAGARWNRDAFWAMGLSIDLPLLAIFLLKRRQIRQKRRREELKKMSIEEL